MRVGAAALRLAGGALLAWWVAVAAAAPEIPRATAAAALAVTVLAMWRPTHGLVAIAALMPAAALFAPPPARGAELLAAAFLLGWLVRVWSPLTPAPWPRSVALPAALYLAMIVASWLALTIGGAAGVAPVNLPAFLLWSIPPDHLVFSSPAPETWTLLLNASGLGLFFAATALGRVHQQLVARIAAAFALSMAALSLATVADVTRQWADAGYAPWFLGRYAAGERFSLHLDDPNAAASLYALAATTAGVLAAFEPRWRWAWIAALAAMVPGMLLAGSATAYLGAFVAGAAAIGWVSRRVEWRHVSRGAAIAAVAFIVIGLATVVLVARRTEGRATAGQALALRADFVQTSVRMFVSAPVLGVGVGRYFDRSAEFMPAALREFYGNENAHSYFLQQFAELGAAGGLLFVWTIVAVLGAGWRQARASGLAEAPLLGLTAGVSAYAVTCLTGHPLLVPAAALPFWAACGAVAGAAARGSAPAASRVWYRAIAAAVAALAVFGTARAAAAAFGADAPPREIGFHAIETDRSGTPFRWMTRHAVSYIPPEAGVVTLRLRHPDEPPRARPLIVEIAIEGRPVASRVLPEEEWTTIDLGVRGRAWGPFRRIDLRANQGWTQGVRLAQRPAERPISAMVRAIEWTSLDVR